MNCLIYPYYNELYSIVDNLGYFSDGLNISVAVYPKAWKKSIVDTNCIESIKITSDYKASVSDVECVIISDVSNKGYMYNDIIEKICYALDMSKKVIICTKINKRDMDMFSIKYFGSQIEYLYDDAHEYDYGIIQFEKQECVTLGVGPLYRGLDNIVAVTYLAREFSEKGYKVTVISDNQSGRLLGFYPFPSDIFNNNEDIEYKVEQLNAYFLRVEKETLCDVMIIQFPEGMLKYSKNTVDSHGIKAYMITRAVSFDYFVLVSMYDICESEQYETINELMNKRYGFEIDSCVIQPVRIYSDFNLEFREYSFTFNQLELYGLKVGKLVENNNNIYELNDIKCYKSIVDNCIDKLS